MIAQLAVCAQKLRLCVAAMALVVNLHAELDVAEQMVIEMQRDAFIDPLAGVFNRAGWINRLAHIDAMDSSSDDDAEIGRAACRERVCAYVEISVVVGALKQKKNTTDNK